MLFYSMHKKNNKESLKNIDYFSCNYSSSTMSNKTIVILIFRKNSENDSFPHACEVRNPTLSAEKLPTL